MVHTQCCQSFIFIYLSQPLPSLLANCSFFFYCNLLRILRLFLVFSLSHCPETENIFFYKSFSDREHPNFCNTDISIGNIGNSEPWLPVHLQVHTLDHFWYSQSTLHQFTLLKLLYFLGIQKAIIKILIF